ncbi:YceI family protein [Actinopolymorpha sp. NPDC004070]|uniref:YceI family protein n=1 Tax=Actinopolymorpha sp. NPDC004070 TaxID=3154548 RepID=UPI0033B4AEB0
MAASAGQVRLGPDNGHLILRTGRQGVASKVGHDLTIEVTDWSAQLDLPADTPADATVTAQINLESLQVREGTGGVKPLTDKDRGEIHGNARRILAVDRHPHATFQSSQVTPIASGATVTGTLTLHGASAPIELHVREVTPHRYHGTAVVVQSAYGIKPYTAFLGALKLRDEVEVEVDIDLSGAERPTRPS